MNILDIIILVCFLPGIIKGVSKGFLEQALTFIGMFAAVFCAFRLRALACEWLEPRLNMSETLLNVTAFALILVGVSLLALLIAKLLTKVIEMMMLGWLNRLLGALMACLTTLIVLGVAIVLFDTINLKFDLVHSPVLDSSVLYAKIKDLAYIAFPYLKQLLLKQS